MSNPEWDSYKPQDQPNYFVVPFGTSMREAKRLLCLQAVAASGGKTQGAKLLGMARSALYKCLAIKPRPKKPDPNQLLLFQGPQDA